MGSTLLDGLPAAQRREFIAASRARRFARGEVVFHDGDPGDTLHLIQSGRVAVRVTTPRGDTATLRIIGPGEHFGELAILSPGPRNATIVALEPTETLGVHRDVLTDLRRRNPSVDEVLLAAVVAEVRRLASALVDAMYVPVATRLARQLSFLADAYSPNAEQVTIPLTQDDLAGLCGTTRPTVNQALKRLESRQVIELARGRVKVLDKAALEQLC